MSRVYIKYLPKDVLLYRLWQNAKISHYFRFCKELVPVLTIDIAKNDIQQMIINNRAINLTTYYGRILYINITDDYVDVFKYNLCNGNGLAEKIISQLKKEEMQSTICTFYKFY